jgi:hypothetical protein
LNATVKPQSAPLHSGRRKETVPVRALAESLAESSMRTVVLVVPEAGDAVSQLAFEDVFHGAQDPSFGVTMTVTPRSRPSQGTAHVLSF